MSNQNPFEFLTNPWGHLPLGSVPPANSTASGAFGSTVPELDKRISELKTVEQWLTLNLNLLRVTIQGMEVQRGTLAAIESFSSSFSQAPPAGSAQTDSSRAQPLPGAEQATWWWNSMHNQFEQMMQAAQAAGFSAQPAGSSGPHGPHGPHGSEGSEATGAANDGLSGYGASPKSPEPAPRAEK